MIISVLSPVHGQAGNTTIALLISLLLSKTQNKSVCLTHLSAKSEAFYTYLGLDNLADKTCTPSQVVKLMREGAISPQDMADYCIRVNENLDIFSNNSKSFSDEDMELMQRYILENMPHDFTVLDIDINTSKPLARLAMEKSGLVIVSLTQSQNAMDFYKEMSEDITALNGKVVFVCNHYSSDVGSIKAFAKSLDVKPNRCCWLHHSEMLMKFSNGGKIDDFIALTKSLPLPEMEADLKRLALAIMQHFNLRGRTSSAGVWK